MQREHDAMKVVMDVLGNRDRTKVEEEEKEREEAETLARTHALAARLGPLVTILQGSSAFLSRDGASCWATD